MSFLSGLFGPPKIYTLERRRNVKDLIKALNDQDWSRHDAAAAALGRLADPRAVVPLIEQLPRDSDNVVKALGIFQDPRVIEPLIMKLQEKSFPNKERASVIGRILAKFGSPAVKRLIDAFDSPGGRWEYIEEALLACGDCAVPTLIAALHDQRRQIRLSAVITLSGLKKVEVTAPLIDALQDEDQDVRRAIVEALGQAPGQNIAQAADALITVLQDPTEDAKYVRYAVIVALGKLLRNKCEARIFTVLWSLAEEIYDTNSQAQRKPKSIGKYQVVKVNHDEGNHRGIYSIYDTCFYVFDRLIADMPERELSIVTT